MRIPMSARARAILTVALLGATRLSSADSLVAFDFDDPSGGFELIPESQHSAVALASFSVSAGDLENFSGVDGRALGASLFVPSNRIRLTLTSQPGLQLQLSAVSFDLRISPSGPPQWQFMVNGIERASGSAGTSFSNVHVVLTNVSPANVFLLDFDGSGALSTQGTLRLDNFNVQGSVSAVPVPPSLALMLAPLFGALTWSRRAYSGLT